MKLSVIIVSYNVKYYIEQCLQSLQKALEGIDAEVYVVDNHSQDDSVEYLSARFPKVNVISRNHNSGFACANNIAIKQCFGEYVLLLNPDTIVAENTIREVISFMDGHPNAGGVGVRMLTSTGENAMESRRGLPTPMTAFYKMCGLCSRFPKSKRFGKYYMSYLSWDEPAQIEIMSGACCFIRHAALDKIGLLDEDFFMYGEDIDLSYRLLKGGFENWYLPSPILHYKGESTQRSSFRYVHVFYEAMLIFIRKHFSHLSWIISIPIKLAIYARAFAALVKMQVERMKKGLGFTSKPSRRKFLYVFFGSKQSLDECREIAKHNGLEAQFIEAEGEIAQSGHVGMTFDKVDKIYVVYDIKEYSYSDIFRIFSSHPDDDIFIGTYDPTTQLVMTPHDIYK